MNGLEQFVPRLRATLQKCIDVLTSPTQIDINAYIVAERESVTAGEVLLKEIAEWEAVAPEIAATIMDAPTGVEFVQMCYDILSQAKESACGDWAESRNTVLDAGEVEQIVSIEFRPQGREDPVFVADDPRNDYKMLDRAALTEAMARIIHQPGLCRAEVRVSVLSAFVKADACNIDDEVCDVIIQIALFGEIVYC